MKLHPFHECARKAEHLIAKYGAQVFQQFNCAHCGRKHTVDVPNTFYSQGICPDCGLATNIEADGCNYAVLFSRRRAK